MKHILHTLTVLSVAGFALFGGCQTVKAQTGTPLTWSPPALTNPTKIEIGYDTDPAFVRITKQVYPYTSTSVDRLPANGKIGISLNTGEDALIALPKDKPLAVGGVVIGNGRNVQIIGGQIMGLNPANDSVRAVLRFAGQSGSVYVEGLILDANNQYGLDGLLVGSVRHAPSRVADVYVQNCLIKGTTSTTKGLHADAFQYYGATHWTRMDRVSVEAQYQGFFLDPQNDIDGIDLRRVDMKYTDPTQGKGYLFFLRVETNRSRHPAVSLEEIYVDEAINRNPWERLIVYPPINRANGGRMLEPGKMSFPAFPEVKGSVIKGKPSAGPFVDETKAGLNYTSPGYL